MLVAVVVVAAAVALAVVAAPCTFDRHQLLIFAFDEVSSCGVVEACSHTLPAIQVGLGFQSAYCHTSVGDHPTLTASFYLVAPRPRTQDHRPTRRRYLDRKP